MLFVPSLIIGVIPGLIAGLIVPAGIKSRKKRKTYKMLSENGQLVRKTESSSLENKEGSIAQSPDNQSIIIPQKPDNINYPVATASLGLISAGCLLLPALIPLGVGGLVYLVWPTWKQAYKDLTQKKRFTRMALESLVLPGTLIAGHFMAAALAYWFLYFALNNVAKAKGSATKNLASVFVTPSTRIVYVLREGVEVEQTLKDVQVGDIVVIGAGEIIPVDGTIIEGHASINQHLLTGESQQVEKQIGDPVLAASMLLTGQIQIKVEKTGEATIASQISHILNEMTSFTENLELRSIRVADRMALPSFLLGSATSVFKGVGSGLAIFWTPMDDALYAAGPLGVLNYLNIALQRGILVKDGSALEVLPHVDTIVFDKTGTLTNEVPQVIKIHACGELSQDEVLRYAAAAEHKQIHPVALAIMEAASAQNIKLPHAQSEAYQTGYGLTVTIEDHTVRVGSHRFMEMESLPLPKALHDTQLESHNFGYSLVYVAVDEVVVGAIELHASVRPGTTETISRLHKFGYKVCIISGDHEKPTRHIAKQLGIDRYFAETLPEDKAKLIKTMQQEGQVVCYVGDGINDTIALKQAEISVSLRGASTIATDTAQVVLMNESLDQIVDLIEIAKQLDRTYKNTALVSAIPTVGIIGGVFLLNFTISTAIFAYLAGMGLSFTSAMLPLAKEWRRTQNEDRETDASEILVEYTHTEDTNDVTK